MHNVFSKKTRKWLKEHRHKATVLQLCLSFKVLEVQCVVVHGLEEETDWEKIFFSLILFIFVTYRYMNYSHFGS